MIDEAGVDIVHGHSSHHPKAIEVYRERPILYGCGDFLNDYEGIEGHEAFRGELGLMYFPTLDASTGRLRALELVPTRIRHFRVNHAGGEDRAWLLDRTAARMQSLRLRCRAGRGGCLRRGLVVRLDLLQCTSRKTGVTLRTTFPPRSRDGQDDESRGGP